MNFTRTIKEELAGHGFGSACCKVACLSAFLRTAGSIVTRGGNVGFSFFTESASTAAFFSDIIEKNFSLKGEINRKGNGGKGKFTAEYIGEGALSVLIELGILAVSKDGVYLQLGIDKYVAESECCKGAYIAGAFLGGGSCTIPTDGGASNTGYHLEFVFSFYETAHDFAELLADFDILAKLIERKNTFVVYVKSTEEIQEFLTITGAEESLLKLAETVITKDLANNANRKLNCDLGNISKQLDASERQTEAISAIVSTVGLDALSDELKAVALLRMSDATLTLGEMAEQLKVSKSCVNHRMRKIIHLANDIKS